jgi:cytochrome c peroxidase
VIAPPDTKFAGAVPERNGGMQAVRLALPFAVIACRSPAAVDKVELGRRLFTDTALSQPPGQACADCHDARIAFADPEGDRTSSGANRDRFGPRNALSVMYTASIPALRRDADGAVGGLFWDGHANSLEDQAAFPLLNPLEMNNPSKASVVDVVRKRHAAAFRSAFGAQSLDDVDVAFRHVTEAIATFERTLSPFSSRYDRYIAGHEVLADDEARGLALFERHCARCHAPPLFTTYRYVNLGVPRFNDNPFYELPADLNPDGRAHVDRGLGETTHAASDDGLFRIPSLRNVALTSPYGHNGYYRRIDEMIEFHTRPSAAPELPATVDRDALVTFRPTPRDISDLVAFLKTLTDE